MNEQDTNSLLEHYLKELRLTTFLQNYNQFADEARRRELGYEQFLLTLAKQEVAQRDHNSQVRRIREAKFPAIKELADFDFDYLPSLNEQQVLELAQGEYIEQAEPVILIGNPGLGKTHIATALALQACQRGRRVRFYNAAALVNDLIQAQDKRLLPKFLDTALRHQLIVVDELGFMPFSTNGAQLLFQFFSALHERVSVIVTTNLKFADWTQILGDERLTVALLDRLTHRAHILEFVGDSYRFHERIQRHSQGA